MSKYDELDFIEWMLDLGLLSYSYGLGDLVQRRQDLMCEIAMADW